jgi:predicted O-methyltransferase YrrM
MAMLPSPARRFYRAAQREAARVGDGRALAAATHPLPLALILRWARGRHSAAEIGSCAGWTALALAAADPARHVVTVEPLPHSGVDRYRALVPEAAQRVEFVTGYGADGPPPGRRFDFMFIDDAHEQAGLVACFTAWRPALEPGALVVFHDYVAGWPDVIAAVAELGLEGSAKSGCFLWTAPG